MYVKRPTRKVKPLKPPLATPLVVRVERQSLYFAVRSEFFSIDRCEVRYRSKPESRSIHVGGVL